MAAAQAPKAGWGDYAAPDKEITGATKPKAPTGQVKGSQGDRIQYAAQSGGLFNFGGGGTPAPAPPPAPSGWRRFGLGVVVGGVVVWVAREVMA